MPISITTLNTSFFGFEELGRIHNLIQQQHVGDIELDCSSVSFVSNSLTAPLRIAVDSAINSGRRVRLLNLKPDVTDALARNGFIKPKTLQKSRGEITLSRFQTNENVRFAHYTHRHLHPKRIPMMSEEVRDKFFESLDEIFANCGLHSEAQKVFASGQFFPRKQILEFTIADDGIGIPARLSRSLTRSGQILRADKAIQWALEQQNTTRVGDIPGGLGLKIIRQFIHLNGGELLICSGGGLWRLYKDKFEGMKTQSRLVEPCLPGTCVVLKIDTSDPHSYGEAQPIDPSSIF